LHFSSEIYSSKSEEILELDQKGKLCHLKLSISMPSLGNFGATGKLCFVFSKFEVFGKIFGIKERGLTGQPS
jgi:hypothetical protein